MMKAKKHKGDGQITKTPKERRSDADVYEKKPKKQDGNR